MAKTLYEKVFDRHVVRPMPGGHYQVMIGLHLIIEGHNLRPLALPLLIINMIQLGLIVLRYVFTNTANPGYLINDLVFFGFMAAFSIFMLAHIGLLAPLRNRLANYFDRNSVAIRTED